MAKSKTATRKPKVAKQVMPAAQMKFLYSLVKADLTNRAELVTAEDPVPVPDCQTLIAMQEAIATLISIHCPIAR